MEVLFVVLILGILLVMGWPGLQREMQRARVQQTVAQTVSLFQSVRMRAIRDNKDRVITLDTAAHEITSAVSGVSSGEASVAIVDLSEINMRFYPPGWPTMPTELQPPTPADCPAVPASITYNNIGNVEVIPVSFCITDHLGNVMKIAIESPVGQPRVYKYITASDPHERYSTDVTGFVLENGTGQEWRWY
jgi:type II secretory pathway pseudopilin PulG